MKKMGDQVNYIEQIKNYNYEKNFKPFKSCIIKKNGKERQCYKIDSSDKSIINAIFDYFQVHLKKNNHQIKSTHSITKQIRWNISQDYKYFYKTDIVQYFGSIDHNTLLEQINKINDTNIFELITRYLNCKITDGNKLNKGLPTGINLTNILSELYLSNFDIEIKKIAKENDFYYYRYCDDILVLSKNNKFANIAYLIDNQLKMIKLEKNIQKTSAGLIKDNGFDYLGFNHTEKYLSISQKSLDSIKGMITSLLLFSNMSSYEEDINEASDPKEQQRIENARLLGLYVSDSEYDENASIVNKIITGYSKYWHALTDDRDEVVRTSSLKRALHPGYGIASYFCLCNKHIQIKELESWIGKIAKKGRKKFCGNMEIVSLRNWFYQYKNNYFKASISAYFEHFGNSNYFNNRGDKAYLMKYLAYWNINHFSDIRKITKRANSKSQLKKEVVRDEKQGEGYEDFFESDDIGCDFEDLDADQKESYASFFSY